MTNPTSQISFAIVGGNSRSGTALRRRIGDGTPLSIIRARAGPGEFSVEQYNRPPSDLDLRGMTVVNCAGAVAGTRDDLLRANVETASRWAQLAADRGARQFIQISSFSIFGGAEKIGQDTPVKPESHYGESKLLAERALADVAGEALPITVLRVPILVGSGQDKLAKLTSLGRRTGFAVSAPWPTPRSMLPYDALAHAIQALAGGPQDSPYRTLFAADPEPFTSQMLLDEARAAGQAMRALRVPSGPLRIVKVAFPSLYTSLFRPSLLYPAANMLADGGEFERLRQVVSTMLRD